MVGHNKRSDLCQIAFRCGAMFISTCRMLSGHTLRRLAVLETSSPVSASSAAATWLEC